MLSENKIRNQSNGAKNRKKKTRQDEVMKFQANDMLKYVQELTEKLDYSKLMNNFAEKAQKVVLDHGTLNGITTN
ncbi:hypothetical protein YC2023_096500 [Brassica napus]